MRLIPWDPDVQTVVSRIDAGILDLQPDFQRGEVWSKSKKQRLIDSILRDWHVPPLHVIEHSGRTTQEVLDGQQRLVAIRDFVRNDFAVDGKIAPKDPRIEQLDQLKYRDLPPETRTQFDRFSLRVYRIVDFASSEPAELFFRLNQPTNLTAAEQRNAFFGPVRQQIKELVERLPALGVSKDVLGFSNTRMAYDDVLCRSALTVELRSLATKIGSQELVELYRAEEPLSVETIEKLETALSLLGRCTKLGTGGFPKFNKATLFSWLLFLVRIRQLGDGSLCQDKLIADFLRFFEGQRAGTSMGFSSEPPATWGNWSADWLLKCYVDRSTSRVADVSSVLLRDLAIWFAFVSYAKGHGHGVDSLPPRELVSLTNHNPFQEEDSLARSAIDVGWATALL